MSIQLLPHVWWDDASVPTRCVERAAAYGDCVSPEAYTESETGSIGKGTEDVTLTKTINRRANKKPWMTANVRQLLKARIAVFRSGNKVALRIVQANLSQAIKTPKRPLAQRIRGCFPNTKGIRSSCRSIHTSTAPWNLSSLLPALSVSPLETYWRHWSTRKRKNVRLLFINFN